MNAHSSGSTPNDITALLAQAFSERVKDIDKSIKLAGQALDQSDEIEDSSLVAWSHAHLGYFNMILTNHQSSQKHAEKAIAHFEKNNDKAGLAFSYFTIGSIKYKTDNYHLALKFLMESFQMYQDVEDQLGQSRTLKAIGSVYEFFEEYDKAEETYQRCIDISRSIGDKNGVSNALNPLSGIFIRKGQTEDALKIIKTSIQLKKSTKDIRGLGFAYYGLGKVYLAQKKYKLSDKYFSKSLEIHTEMQELVGSMMALNKQGLMNYEIGNYDLAKEILHECIQKGKKSKHFLITHKSYWLLYKIAKKENDLPSALEYLELFQEHKQRVVNRETRNVISSIQSMSRLELLEKETKWQKEINTEIERKNKELDSFVYKVSHDLRGPISSLMGLFDLVRYDVTDVKSLEYFEIYNRQINRLNEILVDFLSLIQIKEKKIQQENIDFEDLIESCLNSFRYHQNYEKIDFEIRIKDSVAFRSDKSTVTSILQNLLENSIKYANTKSAPFVKINIQQLSRHVSIKITDNGMGIRKGDQKKIFDMFFRSHVKIKGTGLGLYIVKCAVEKLGGDIDVKSKIHQGTTVQVTLPL